MCTPLMWPNEATPRPAMSAPCQSRSRYTKREFDGSLVAVYALPTW